MEENNYIRKFNEQNLIILYFISISGFLISSYCTFKYLRRLDELIIVAVLSVLFATASNEIRKSKYAGRIIDNVIGLVFIFIIYRNIKQLATGAYYL
ncbi:MAG TPA: hypothetical protein ENN73_06500, partial [Firmicutes bacterium]|nr:hypothetical protein [Bacillota bacterium]